MRKWLRSLGAILLAICLSVFCFACGDTNPSPSGDGNGGDSETPGGMGGNSKTEESVEFLGAAESSCATLKEALLAYVAEEMAYEDIFDAQYVSHTVDDKIKKVNATGEWQEILKNFEIQKYHVNVRIFARAGEDGDSELSEMFPAETVTQTVYVASAENTYAYLQTAPIQGERMCNSYACELLDVDKYENCTVAIGKTHEVNGGAAEFAGGTEIKMTRLAAYVAQYGAEESFAARKPAYRSPASGDSETFYFLNTDNREEQWARQYTSETPDWTQNIGNSDFLQNKALRWENYIGELLLVAPVAYVAEADNTFTLYVAGEQEGQKEVFVTLTANEDGAIVHYTDKEFYTEDDKQIVARTYITINAFGETMVQLPDGAELGTPLEKQLTVLLQQSSQYNGIQKVLTEEGKKAGIAVRFHLATGSSIQDQLRIMVQTGKTPDLILFPESNSRYFIEKGVFADITTYAQQKEYADILADLQPKLQNAFLYDRSKGVMGEGARYGVPVMCDTEMLTYNKTLIESGRDAINAEFNGDESISRNNDGSVKLPWEMDFTAENYTWTQYKRMAQALQQSGALQSGYACVMPDIETLVRSFGGKLLSDDRATVLPDEDVFMQAVQYQATLAQTQTALCEMNDYTAILQRRTCFATCFGSQRADLDAALGEGNWGVMPYPADDGAAFGAWQAPLGTMGLFVGTASRYKEDAVALLMSVFKDEHKAALLQDGALPVLRSMEDAYHVSARGTLAHAAEALQLEVLHAKAYTPAYMHCRDSSWMERIHSYLMRIWQDPAKAQDKALFAQYKNSAQQIYDQSEKE